MSEPQATDKAIPPNTTAEQQMVTAGRRRINAYWELTQALIAIIITVAVVYAELSGKSSTILSNAFTLIVAIYFVRMNHTKMGGLSGNDQERK